MQGRGERFEWLAAEQARFRVHSLLPLNADLDQNNEPEAAQRGEHLDAYQAA